MLTEREVIACLKENFRLAAENCLKLARGERGPIYVSLRAELKLVEGAARQLSALREDTRWLQVGLKVAEAQKRCGDWLRAKEPGWRFEGLAQILVQGLRSAHDLETKATGRRGMILPIAQPAPHRDHRPVAVGGGPMITKVEKPKLIIPPGVSVH